MGNEASSQATMMMAKAKMGQGMKSLDEKLGVGKPPKPNPATQKDWNALHKETQEEYRRNKEEHHDKVTSVRDRWAKNKQQHAQQASAAGTFGSFRAGGGGAAASRTQEKSVTAAVTDWWSGGGGGDAGGGEEAATTMTTDTTTSATTTSNADDNPCWNQQDANNDAPSAAPTRKIAPPKTSARDRLAAVSASNVDPKLKKKEAKRDAKKKQKEEAKAATAAKKQAAATDPNWDAGIMGATIRDEPPKEDAKPDKNAWWNED